MDVTWGDAEMTLAVHPDHQKKGCGSYILEQLQKEAAGKGINYLYNTVRPTHPDEYDVTKWLKQRQFVEHDDGVLRRAVNAGD
ncbi:MAG: GNAT family N-acetyltransferase [Planctomycetota bacterium]